MNYSQLPQPVLAKLITLDSQAEALAQRAEALPRLLDSARNQWRSSNDPGIAQQARADTEAMTKEQQFLTARVAAEQSVLSNCKLWLDQLPADTRLEPVTSLPPVILTSVRGRLEQARRELTELRKLATPAADIEARLRAHVADLGRVTVTGIGAGDALSVTWPGPQHGGRDPLHLFAALFPDQVVDLLRRAVATTVNAHPLPLAQRPARIAALERELLELEHGEEALIEAAIARGEAVHRSRTASPAAVLGVRVVAAQRYQSSRYQRSNSDQGRGTPCCVTASARRAGLAVRVVAVPRR